MRGGHTAFPVLKAPRNPLFALGSQRNYCRGSRFPFLFASTSFAPSSRTFPPGSVESLFESMTVVYAIPGFTVQDSKQVCVFFFVICSPFVVLFCRYFSVRCVVVVDWWWTYPCTGVHRRTGASNLNQVGPPGHTFFPLYGGDCEPSVGGRRGADEDAIIGS